MGQEMECSLRLGRRTLRGKAYLETTHLLFRGEERLKIPLKDLRAVEASAGILRLDFEGGPAEFELGKAAEKWARKILRPPSRLDKLGVRPGMVVTLSGEFEADFVGELREAKADVVAGGSQPDLLFLAAETARDLSAIAKLARSRKPRGALWVVYPKGISAIREIEVLEAGRAAGLKDVKVASFSATRTALKFV
jgi:hypothetical protein